MPEQIIIDLSGQKGLGPNFFGDSDMITPQPNLRINPNGEMAQGLFNPYLRKGYLSPISTTSTSLTPIGTPDTKLTSVVYDSSNETLYLADRGVHIYELSSLNDVTMSLTNTLNTGDIIQDLEIYEVDSKRSLFYLYSTTAIEDSLNLGNRAWWTTTSVEVNPMASYKPRVMASHSKYVTTSSAYSVDIQVPSSNNIACIVHIRTPGTVTSATVNGAAMTQNSVSTKLYSSSTYKTYVYSLSNVGSGTLTLETVATGSYILNVVFTDNTSTSPVNVVNNYLGITNISVTQATYSDTKLLLSFLGVNSAVNELSTTQTLTTYDDTAVTGNNGFAVALKTDGTKMYINGGTGAGLSVFQYTLGTAWQISAGVVYDTVSLNYSAELPASTLTAIRFNDTGTKMYLIPYTETSATFAAKTYDLGTAWDLSTAVYNATKDSPSADNDGQTAVYGFAITSDGTDYYLSGKDATSSAVIFRYTMSTPWDLSTATYTNKKGLDDVLTTDVATPGGCFLNNSDTIFYIVHDVNGNDISALNFDPRFPKDITKLSEAISSIGVVDRYTNASARAFFSSGQQINRYIYFRRNSGGTEGYDVCRLDPSTSSAPLINTTNRTIDYINRVGTWGSVSYLPQGKTIECGTAPLPDKTTEPNAPLLTDDTWLTETLGVRITSLANHNFIVPSDNGFAYLCVGNAVHQIDGGITGGVNGSVTKNVLLFPEMFTITDAVDFRSRLYIAVHQYPVDIETTSLLNYSGRCGVLIWDRQSTRLVGSDYIELPGVREIKKVYASPDGVIKLIVISDSGLTQIRMFGYNDSGSAVFRVVRTLGAGAYPQYPDGHSTAGDKVIWLANDGNLYCEKNEIINILHQVKAPGVTTALKYTNISSGITFYGSGDETASPGYRSNKQGIILSYLDTATKYYKKIYPMDIMTGSNGNQTPNQGDVYTGVTYLPTHSKVTSVRIYNLPVSGTGTTVIATVKLYFNQSTTAAMPDGITKSITLDEARRGYVDLNINKPYIHAIQLEVEWATGISLGADTYLPSIAIITHENTSTKSPDNG